jgi:geranyl-CoA carboxylase alpha subunit
MTAFSKILVANRGEIAVRVIRSARVMGYRTVAVYSEADADALHVKEADQAVCIGAAPVGQSYLVADKIIAAAQATGADAIHPGYGFLSENADFARACDAAGLVFIGPPASAIELMGSKRLSKLAMLEAGVPCIPGYQGDDQGDETLLQEALGVGFPLMVKASAGGGGRGMRLVFEESELAQQLRSARSEAQSAFGSGELILERAVLQPRHIEIQVFADAHGNVVHLGERDCSIQRRHQKVVEEAPSPFVDEALRQAMGEAAVNAARACNYRGAGTVEFLVDAQRNFYFLEMNTRLQVEHPVTELVTGQDLVDWQLAVAAGETLPLTQDEISLQGHAIEVRLYAEDPRGQFLPQTGQIARFDYPRREGVRVDHGLAPGQAVTPHYDPMLAKIICWGRTRQEACRRLASAVQDSNLLGVNNNKLFLQNVLRHPVFRAGDATTAFIEQHFQQDPSMDASGPAALSLAIAALLYTSLGSAHPAWRAASGERAVFTFSCGGNSYNVKLARSEDRVEIVARDQALQLQLVELAESDAVIVCNGVREKISYVLSGGTLYLDDGSGHHEIHDITHQPAAVAGGAGSGQLKASMDGAIVDILVSEGDIVTAGQTMLVLEAMKMEHPLKSGIDGVVGPIGVAVGDQVKGRQLLLSVEA